jgi:hypothetical protein
MSAVRKRFLVAWQAAVIAVLELRVWFHRRRKVRERAALLASFERARHLSQQGKRHPRNATSPVDRGRTDFARDFAARPRGLL